MREALTELIQEVRAAGVPVSVAESMDALRAASAVALERETLREALAAALVKDEADRAAFDECFDRFFAAGEGEGRRLRRRAAAAGGEGGSGGTGDAGRTGGEKQRISAEPREPAARPRMPVSRSAELRSERRPGAPREVEHHAEVWRRLRRRELLRKPFREMDPLEAEELAELAAELSRRFRAHLRRRLRYGTRGRLDFRRTLRRSIGHGGAAFDLVLRRRRPARPDLVALCDVSGSVRWASEFFAALLRPCEDFFRRVRLFVFVDRPVEATFENGHLVPHAPVDFHAFSDFGRVLVDLDATLFRTLGRSTLVVVLGDARNNRRPARADLLARLRPRVRTVWWLDPERRERWSTGDSAIESYRPHCDALLECADGASLLAALARISR